ncbi:unnamed protein product [Ambrosiozyma monospora]|uniref:Unnamed protein product n=1 Tax=Ambrosiozyma monospora TaxID=43982 RepID=A0ACB5TWI3_AMBMO|nr:unnamed protein product [Ambrosiozyma monospora]
MISISRVQLFLSLSVLATAFNPTPDTPSYVEAAQSAATSESNGLQLTRGAGSVFGGPLSLGHGPVIATDITFTVNTANSFETNAANIKRDDAVVTESVDDVVTETAASEESEATYSADAENTQVTEAGDDTAVTGTEETGSASTGFGGEESGSLEPTGTFQSGEGFASAGDGIQSRGPFGGHFSGFPTDFSFTGFPSDFTFPTNFPSGSGHHHFPHPSGSFTGFPSDFSVY